MVVIRDKLLADYDEWLEQSFLPYLDSRADADHSKWVQIVPAPCARRHIETEGRGDRSHVLSAKEPTRVAR